MNRILINVKISNTTIKNIYIKIINKINIKCINISLLFKIILEIFNVHNI